MIKKLTFALLITTGLLLGLQAKAQNITIDGTIMDSISKKSLTAATVSLANAKDSSLINFTRASDDGYFQFKNIAPGKYLLSVSYVGYAHLWLGIKVGSTPSLSLGNIYLVDASQLSTVTVTARRPPVVINGDSIEFNSENFKTVPNAVVEDLLKKIRGDYRKWKVSNKSVCEWKRIFYRRS